MNPFQPQRDALIVAMQRQLEQAQEHARDAERAQTTATVTSQRVFGASSRARALELATQTRQAAYVAREAASKAAACVVQVQELFTRLAALAPLPYEISGARDVFITARSYAEAARMNSVRADEAAVRATATAVRVSAAAAATVPMLFETPTA